MRMFESFSRTGSTQAENSRTPSGPGRCARVQITDFPTRARGRLRRIGITIITYVCRILREVQRPRDSHTKYCANFNIFSHCAPPPLISRNFARKPTPPKFRKTFREILGYGNRQSPSARQTDRRDSARAQRSSFHSCNPVPTVPLLHQWTMRRVREKNRDIKSDSARGTLRRTYNNDVR